MNINIFMCFTLLAEMSSKLLPIIIIKQILNNDLTSIIIYVIIEINTELKGVQMNINIFMCFTLLAEMSSKLLPIIIIKQILNNDLTSINFP
jgi:hypothetical protein